MASVLDKVDQRTRLAGENRLELLLFNLGGRQHFGINVFKVQEVIRCPGLTGIPHAHRIMKGLAHLRGKTIPILDLALAIGKPAMQEIKDSYVIISEYNRSTQGFLVNGVDKIVNVKWDDVKPPPKGLGNDNYMTAVTNIDNELVEIIDVEKILADMMGIVTDLKGGRGNLNKERSLRILVADDSSVARKQIKKTLDQMGVEVTLANDGKQAHDILKQAVSDGSALTEHFDLLISDVEMPVMDGYTLTKAVRDDERLRDIPIMLHTSLSGSFNDAMIKKVGADRFVPKFRAEEFADEVTALAKDKGLL
ncbi:MAG: chemotaxis protein CheV [Gammaproteobacteria bacterium]